MTAFKNTFDKAAQAPGPDLNLPASTFTQLWFTKHLVSWAVVLMVFAWDGMMTGTVFMSMVLMVACTLRALLNSCISLVSKKSQDASLRSFGVMFIGAALTMTYGFYLDRQLHLNATPVIQALESYRATNGGYPESLEALVPTFLPSIPKMKPVYMPPAARYQLTETGPRLTIGTSGGYSFESYDFEKRVWEHFD